MAVKLGNGNWAVKEDKLLAYNDNSGRFFNKEFDFARGSIATYVGKDGLIKSAASDVPRIDFSDSTNGALLLEGQSTNLVNYSQDFNQSYWTKANTLILSNAVISPDSSLNSDKLYEDASSSSKLMFKSGISTLGTISVFVKKGNENNRLFQIRRDGGSNSWSWFNLDNGLIEYEENGIANIKNYGNGWYRCSFTPTNSNGTIVFAISNGGLGRSVSYQGDGTSGVYIYGAQLEQGSYATSYIPSLSGSTTTRLADVCNNSGSAQDFNSESGVLYAEIAALVDGSISRRISLSDGTSNNRLFLFINSSQLEAVVVVAPNAPVVLVTNIDNTIFNKIAFNYKSGDSSLFINGVKISNSTNAFTIPNLSKLSFDNGFGGDDFYGKTKDIQVFTEAKSDEFLAELTTI